MTDLSKRTRLRSDMYDVCAAMNDMFNGLFDHITKLEVEVKGLRRADRDAYLRARALGKGALDALYAVHPSLFEGGAASEAPGRG